MEQINYNLIRRWDEQVGTPFYIMRPDVYEQNLKNFLAAFCDVYPRIIAGYSFKTNYVPALCIRAKRLGCYAEVVSVMELQLAKRLEFEHIIFNGPIKTDSALFDALDYGAIVNLDSEYEVDAVLRYRDNHPSEPINVGIRINVSLKDEDGNSTIQCGLRSGRFGFPNEILQYNIERLKKANVRIICVHGHTSSSDRAVINYAIIAESMLDTIHRYQLDDVSYFDVGGGFFGAAAEGIDVTNKPRYQDYADCILQVVMNDEWFRKHRPYIVIEPGASVVSNVFSYVTKIYQNKQINGTNFVTVDGSVFDAKPTLHGFNLPHSVYRQEETEGDSVCDVVGSTCMEKDIILKGVTLPRVKKGDYILMRGVGAYTICLTPTFINYLAPILCVNDGESTVVRRRQSLDDVLGIYNW